MSPEPMRRFGAVNFEKSQITELANPAFEKEVFRGLMRSALDDAKMKWGDDFSLRLIVTENLPEDRPRDCACHPSQRLRLMSGLCSTCGGRLPEDAG